MASQDCQVCLEQYDDEGRRPRCLSCGHTLCTSCLTDTLARGPLTCPFCRVLHATPVTRVEDVPVNYAVVSLLKDAAYSAATQRSQALLAEVKREASEFITEQMVTCNCNLTRLKDFQQRLSEQQKLHQVHMQALQSLVDRHERVLQDMGNVSDQIVDTVREGEEQRAALEAAQGSVDAAQTLLQVTAAHQHHQGLDHTVQEWSTVALNLLQSQVVFAAKEVSYYLWKQCRFIMLSVTFICFCVS